MKALYKDKAGPGLILAERPEPTPQRGEVKIRVARTGICGTDLHIESWDAWAAGAITAPLIPGHEFSGHACCRTQLTSCTSVTSYTRVKKGTARGRCASLSRVQCAVWRPTSRCIETAAMFQFVSYNVTLPLPVHNPKVDRQQRALC